MSASKFRLALIQLAVTTNKTRNLERARKLIREAASTGAQMLCLPEFFNFPFHMKYYAKYAEPVPGRTSEMLSRCAEEHRVYLVGGTVSENDNGRLYNTCLVYGPDARCWPSTASASMRHGHPRKDKHPRVGLLRRGDRLTTFDTPFCKVGVGICYDLRFATQAQIYAELNCKLLVYPGAFNLATGPLHWKLLQRARAVDNQVYVASTSLARDEAACYVTWGYSMIVDPSGKVVQSAGVGEELVVAEVDLGYLDTVRDEIPVTKQKRNDLYKIVSCKGEESGCITN
ncbi:carbon-nitrogen hydrolase, putative [Ixodes scapularis]|uniref:omega-amidase n=1 Tax=Ixodes scapularis TaxID=6945 RepID=B7P0Z9_IXOSC|nr:carbon-nitrogen hydrolase, putative [Ixodes scapularis]|eukprot:XP_002399761.1 carbon-nitrogen hydrolase, putative [Ixodes scapularis]